MSLEPCVCTQGLVLLPNRLQEEMQMHPLNRLPALGSIAVDYSICVWFTITLLSFIFPPMQICEGLIQASSAHLTCQPGKLRQCGKGRRNKPHWVKCWPSLVFPWIKEGTAKLTRIVNAVHNEKECRWREMNPQVACLSFSLFQHQSLKKVWYTWCFQERRHFVDMLILEVFGCHFG